MNLYAILMYYLSPLGYLYLLTKKICIMVIHFCFLKCILNTFGYPTI